MADTDFSVVDLDDIQRTRKGMLTLFKVTLIHIFGLTEEQVDKVVHFLRTLDVTSLDMQEEFVTTNLTALTMLKAALSKELDDEDQVEEIKESGPFKMLSELVKRVKSK